MNAVLKWLIFALIQSPFLVIGGLGLSAAIYTAVTRIGIIGGIFGMSLFLCAFGWILSTLDLYKGVTNVYI